MKIVLTQEITPLRDLSRQLVGQDGKCEELRVTITMSRVVKTGYAHPTFQKE